MKVLVVDDDVVSRMVLMHLIDNSGKFEIAEAEDGEEAWQQMQQGEAPAICFCDLRMPRLSGMDLLARVRADARLAALPFVLVSSAAEGDTVDEASGRGATGYIVKPFDADQVRAQLAAVQPADLVAEMPLATMQRLGINSERLLLYLGGFQSQLAVAATETAQLLENGEDDAARVRIERLHAGCVTLGLHGAAAALAAFVRGPLDGVAIGSAIDGSLRAVVAQGERVRRMQTVSGGAESA